MAHESEYTMLEEIVQLLSQDGERKFARVIEKVVNEAMKLERAQALKAQPYERTEDREGYANGFKDKTLTLASGKILLKIPRSAAWNFIQAVSKKASVVNEP